VGRNACAARQVCGAEAAALCLCVRSGGGAVAGPSPHRWVDGGAAPVCVWRDERKGEPRLGFGSSGRFVVLGYGSSSGSRAL
jgi:hypothetical protein